MPPMKRQTQLSAVYSRSLEQAQAFGANYQVTQFFDSLEAMAQSDAIDAVYIASPNSCTARNRYCSCAIKARDLRKAAGLQPARSGTAGSLRAGKSGGAVRSVQSAYLPNFLALQQALPKVGRLRKAFINYCQYSSRYPRYLAGENPNTFNPSSPTARSWTSATTAWPAR